MSLLPAAIDEFNRYNHSRLVIGEPLLRTLPISGRFRSEDPSGFVDALRMAYGVVETLESSGERIRDK